MMSRHSNFQRGGALRRSQHKHFVENAGQWVANIYVNGLAANQMEVFVDRGDVVVRSKECVQKSTKPLKINRKFGEFNRKLVTREILNVSKTNFKFASGKVIRTGDSWLKRLRIPQNVHANTITAKVNAITQNLEITGTYSV